GPCSRDEGGDDDEYPDRGAHGTQQRTDADADHEDECRDRLPPGPRPGRFEPGVDAGEGAEGRIDGEVEAVDAQQHEERDGDSQSDAERGNVVAFARWDAEELLHVAQAGSAPFGFGRLPRGG